MSEFHPPINTLEEWNERLQTCNCCQMPTCEAPILDCQNLAYVPCVIVVDQGLGTWNAYKKQRLGAAFDPIVVTTWTGEWVFQQEYFDCDTVIEDPPEDEPVNEFLEPVSCSDMQSKIAGITPDFGHESVGNTCMASFFCEWPDGPLSELSIFRYRWRVAPCHPGSYYKIEWDEIFFPLAYLDWLEDAQDPDVIAFDPNANPPPALPVITTKNWEWEGTALGDCVPLDPTNNYDYRKDIAERMSDWSGPVRTTEQGIIEIHNVRVYCYRSTYGSKPQYVTPAGGSTGTYSTGDVDQDGAPDIDEPTI
jgi:hypothetical protein